MSELLDALNKFPPNFEHAEKLIRDHQQKNASMDLNQSDGSAPIHIAASYKNLHFMQLLIDHGADVHLKNFLGDSALSIFMRNNFIEGAEFLVKNKVDLSEAISDYAKDHEGFNAYHAAIMNGHVDMIDYLMKKGVPGLDQPTGHGESSLSLACAIDTETLEALLDRGLDVNQPSGPKTPLMVALTYNQEDMVHLLISRGANVNAATPKGYTVLDHAKKGSACEALIKAEIERLALLALTSESKSQEGQPELFHKDKLRL